MWLSKLQDRELNPYLTFILLVMPVNQNQKHARLKWLHKLMKMFMFTYEYRSSMIFPDVEIICVCLENKFYLRVKCSNL